jgi:maltooligosyltrehalose trehalohydrolase
VGNRAQGERLSHDASAAAYRAASALLLFVPQLPLLFMGQEWGASTPFQFFTDHGEELGKQVTEGRKKEFADFAFDDVPDPQDPATFERSQLRWAEMQGPPHSLVLRWYRDLLTWRKRLTGDVHVEAPVPGGLVLHRGRHRLLVALEGDVLLPKPAGMDVRLSSEEPLYASAPQPPEIGGAPARSPHIPTRAREGAQDAVASAESLASDQVRFWRPAALLWEAI